MGRKSKEVQENSLDPDSDTLRSNTRVQNGNEFLWKPRCWGWVVMGNREGESIHFLGWDRVGGCCWESFTSISEERILTQRRRSSSEPSYACWTLCYVRIAAWWIRPMNHTAALCFQQQHTGNMWSKHANQESMGYYWETPNLAKLVWYGCGVTIS